MNSLLERIDKGIRIRLLRTEPWTNVYGLSRTLIAVASLMTLLVNDTSLLFKEAAGLENRVFCEAHTAMGLYCLVPEVHLEVARWIAILVLILAASGWRPRITALPHWYVTISFHMASVGIDGGDQISANLALLLLPIALTDRRIWHWQSPEVPFTQYPIGRLVAIAGYILIQVQVSVIYFQAAIAKTGVSEWMDGTALYYWLNSSSVGLPNYLRPFFQPILASDLVAAMTWSILLLELLLAASPLMEMRWKKVLLPVGFAFHLGIAFFLGISSFAIVMLGALILHLRVSREAFMLPSWLKLRLPKLTQSTPEM